jgi:hypothetical protein
MRIWPPTIMPKMTKKKGLMKKLAKMLRPRSSRRQLSWLKIWQKTKLQGDEQEIRQDQSRAKGRSGQRGRRHVRVEDHSREFLLLRLAQQLVRATLHVEDLLSAEVKDKTGDNLEDGLDDDHLEHVDRDERRTLAVGLALEGVGRGGVSGESEGGEGAARKERESGVSLIGERGGVE